MHDTYKITRTVRHGAPTIVTSTIQYLLRPSVCTRREKEIERTDCFQEKRIIVEIVLYERHCAMTLHSRSLYDNIKCSLFSIGVLNSLADTG